MSNKKAASVRASIIKADAPTQIEVDEKMNASDWLEPDLPLENLGEMVKNSGILPQCVRAYKNNIAGYGIGIKYIEDDQKETPEAKAEWQRLKDIINLLTIEEDTKEIFEDIIESREKYGIAYCEVIRDRQGNVVQLEFIKEVPTIRMSRPREFADLTYYYHGQKVVRKKKFRIYKQTVGGTTVYFKEFGDQRIMDLRDGKFYDGVDIQYQANEIIEFKIGTDNYGEIRWIGQILATDGSRRAEHLNNNYFINGRHTPLLICIKGGTLTGASYEKLKAYMNGIRGENGQHAFLILETEALDNDFDAKQPEIEIKDLASILQKDELFQEYIENNRKRVQSSFNLPDLYVGYTQDFNRATAQMAQEVTEKQVFQPERTSLAWQINNRLLNGYQFKYCEVEFLAPDITNPDDLFKILSITERAGGLPPNKAKQIAYDAIGEDADDYEGDWGDIPLVVAAQLNAKEQAEQQRQMQSEQMKARIEGGIEPSQQQTKQGITASNIDDTTMGQLNNQITKAESNNEPEELIAVMKSVRNLLKEIKDQEAGT